MKQLSTVMACLMVLSLVAGSAPSLAAMKGAKHHQMTVEFVSYDAESNTLAFKDENGERKTAPVLEPATQEKIAELESGEQIVITCDDDENGQHMGVSKFKKAKVAKS